MRLSITVLQNGSVYGAVYCENTDKYGYITAIYGPYFCVHSDGRIRTRIVWPGDGWIDRCSSEGRSLLSGGWLNRSLFIRRSIVVVRRMVESLNRSLFIRRSIVVVRWMVESDEVVVVRRKSIVVHPKVDRCCPADGWIDRCSSEGRSLLSGGWLNRSLFIRRSIVVVRRMVESIVVHPKVDRCCSVDSWYEEACWSHRSGTGVETSVLRRSSARVRSRIAWKIAKMSLNFSRTNRRVSFCSAHWLVSHKSRIEDGWMDEPEVSQQRGNRNFQMSDDDQSATRKRHVLSLVCFFSGWWRMLASPVNLYSILAGVSASLASIFGKLTFSQPTFVSLLAVVYIALFVFSNVFMWRCYSKALSLSSTSIQPTIVTKTSNFLLSALVGFFVLSESINLTWLFGFLLILVGVYLISTEHESAGTQVSSHLDWRGWWTSIAFDYWINHWQTRGRWLSFHCQLWFGLLLFSTTPSTNLDR